MVCALVQKGDFEISTATPIMSLLRIWAVAGGDAAEDHVEVRSVMLDYIVTNSLDYLTFCSPLVEITLRI